MLHSRGCELAPRILFVPVVQQDVDPCFCTLDRIPWVVIDQDAGTNAPMGV